MCAPPGPGGRRPSGDPGRVRALRGHRGVPDGGRPGDRRSGLRHRVGAGGGRDRRPGQPLRPGGQAAGGRSGGNRRGAGAERAGGGGHGRSGSGADRSRPAWPRRSTARTARCGACRPTRGCWTRSRTRWSALLPSGRACRRGAPADPRPTTRGEAVRHRRRDRTRAPGAGGRGGRGAGRPGPRPRAACSWEAEGGHRLRGLRGRAPTTCCRRVARCASSPPCRAATFRRRMARVSLPGEAASRLAPAGAALARAEGFPVHAESMERRA